MSNNKLEHEREKKQIAVAAARLWVEDGERDFARAKAKAAHQLGDSPHAQHFPDNAQISEEIRRYRACFHGDTERALLHSLRCQAIDYLQWLAPFHPYLTGDVADNSVDQFSTLDFLLFPDSGKEVEIFLLNVNVEPRLQTPRHPLIESILCLDNPVDPRHDIRLYILPPGSERQKLRFRDGRPWPRLSLPALQRQLTMEINAKTEVDNGQTQ